MTTGYLLPTLRVGGPNPKPGLKARENVQRDFLTACKAGPKRIKIRKVNPTHRSSKTLAVLLAVPLLQSGLGFMTDVTQPSRPGYHMKGFQL